MEMLHVLESFWPTTISGWITLISLFVGLVAAIIGLIPTVKKLGVALAELAKNKQWSKILEIAKEGMEIAEQSGKTGEQKLSDVIDYVKLMSADLHIDISEENLDNLKQYITEIINWHNAMNDAVSKNNTKNDKATNKPSSRKFLLSKEEEK